MDGYKIAKFSEEGRGKISGTVHWNNVEKFYNLKYKFNFDIGVLTSHITIIHIFYFFPRKCPCS